MKEKKSISSIIKDIVFFIIVIFILTKIYGVYKKYYYNGFTKAEFNQGSTKFTRDNIEKYSDEYSYKVYSEEYNDAMFYKNIDVEPNTPYKITCMVKTDNVQTEETPSNSGAQICIVETTQCSKSITGTNGWQQIEYMFNSKNETNIQIGFRLGGNEDDCKGTAWFSDFKLEKGTQNKGTEWNFACFIIKNIDVKMKNDENIQLSMNEQDIDTIKNNMSKFKTACASLSNNKMSVIYDMYQIDEPLTSVTYSEEFGNYVDPKDAKELIEPYLKGKNYDHIFVVVRLGNLDENIEIQVNDWIGLGSMDLYGIGFSNIRLPNNKNSYIYTYNPSVNTFPEEVFIHEFLHSLERNLKEYGYERPELHSYQTYGYKEETLEGLKEWYKDYMQCTIKNSNGENIGLNEIVYTLKPTHESNFKYGIEVKFNKEPKNIIEEIKQFFNGIGELI